LRQQICGRVPSRIRRDLLLTALETCRLHFCRLKVLSPSYLVPAALSRLKVPPPFLSIEVGAASSSPAYRRRRRLCVPLSPIDILLRRFTTGTAARPLASGAHRNSARQRMTRSQHGGRQRGPQYSAGRRGPRPPIGGHPRASEAGLCCHGGIWMENRINGGGTHDLRIGGGRTDTEPTPSLLAPEKNRGGQRRKKSRVRKKNPPLQVS
jgi:hypothetical protein